MFETDEFLTMLRAAIVYDTSMAGLKEYEPSIVGFLQRLAIQNESALMEIERRKTPSERRGMRDAEASMHKLIKQAAGYAALEKRTVLKEVDVEQAYRALFCGVWPFCRS